MRCLFLILCIWMHSMFCDDKVLIITSAYNRPDFVEIQHKTFQKFLEDEYELVVFNDSRDLNLKQDIENTCKRLNIKCINVPQEIHKLPYLYRLPREDINAPSVRNANVVQYGLNQVGFSHQGIVVVIDADLFLVKPFSFKKYLDGFQLAGVPQSRKSENFRADYLWIGIAFLDMRTLVDKEEINFNCGEVHGIPVDAGGYTHHYLEKHPQVALRLFGPSQSENLVCAACKGHEGVCTHNTQMLQESGYDPFQIAFLQEANQGVEFFINGTFFHYRSGSNWNRKSQEYHDKKTESFNRYIYKILNQD